MNRQPDIEIWARDVGGWLNCGLKESMRARRARPDQDRASIHVAEVVKDQCIQEATGGSQYPVPQMVRYDAATKDAPSLRRQGASMPSYFMDWLRSMDDCDRLERTDIELKADFGLGADYRVRFRAEVETLMHMPGGNVAIFEMNCNENPPTQALAKLAMTAWLWATERGGEPAPVDVIYLWLPRQRNKQVQSWRLPFEKVHEYGKYSARMAATHARDLMPTPGYFCHYCPVKECLMRMT